jgi:GH15 family glucan-1,4-alpha-glucosidase
VPPCEAVTVSDPASTSAARASPPLCAGSCCRLVRSAASQIRTFSACSFWYVEALTRAGRLDEARLAFEKMLTYANHLGLYAEQISRNGEQQGNFPQALTHLALISAAFNLDRALG